MKPHLKYLSYVIRHKFFVFVAGRRLGVPLRQLIVHDWSKFTHAEWGPYVRTFYGPVRAGTESDEAIKVQLDFNRAWLHHQHKNPHHWQHWVLREDDGDTWAVTMPHKYVLEMVADWMGAGRAITGKWEVEDWYFKNKHKMTLSVVTKGYVDRLLLGGE